MGGWLGGGGGGKIGGSTLKADATDFALKIIKIIKIIIISQMILK